MDRVLSEIVTVVDTYVSDELVQSAACLALALLKKLPSVYMEDHLIRELVPHVRVNPVRPNLSCWCVVLLVVNCILTHHYRIKKRQVAKN